MDQRLLTERDRSLGLALEVVMRRNRLGQAAAAAVLFDMAQELEVDVDDLARLVATAETRRRSKSRQSV